MPKQILIVASLLALWLLTACATTQAPLQKVNIENKQDTSPTGSLVLTPEEFTQDPEIPDNPISLNKQQSLESAATEAVPAKEPNLPQVSSIEPSLPATSLAKTNLPESSLILPPQQEKPPSIWEKIANASNFAIPYHQPELKKALKLYTGNQSFFDRISEFGQYVLYHIVETLEKKNLPLELAVLAIVESDLNPFAYSFAKASGIWQIIPSTAKYLQLEINWWIDERRDIVLSTEKGLEYLVSNYRRFENWDHAMAAYNSGPNRVSQAIKSNKRKGRKTDYWSLKLPQETSFYLPKFYAILTIIRNPELFEVVLPYIPSKPYFAVVDTPEQVSIPWLAGKLEVSKDELYRLNPAYNHFVTQPSNNKHILVPFDKKQQAEQAIAAYTNARYNKVWQRFMLLKGEKVTDVPKKIPVSLAAIDAVNDKKYTRSTNLNRQILIDMPKHRSRSFAQLVEERLQLLKNKTEIKKYKVKPGDNLWNIARKHKISAKELRKMNGLPKSGLIFPGMELMLTLPSEVAAIQYTENMDRKILKKLHHKVKQRETLISIARKYGTKLHKLIEWNKDGLSENRLIRTGQRLVVFVDLAKGYR